MYVNDKGETVKGVCSNFLCKPWTFSHGSFPSWLEVTGLLKSNTGESVLSLCSGDLKPGEPVNITGPVGKEMLMPKDPNATIIMVRESGGLCGSMFATPHQCGPNVVIL